MSGSISGSSESTVAITCTSLRKPSGNRGRSGRSMRREVSVSFSVGRPSRLKKPPGNLPRGVRLLDVVHRQREEIAARLRRARSNDGRQHRGVAEAHEHRTGCLARYLARLKHEFAGTVRNRLLDGCHGFDLERRAGASASAQTSPIRGRSQPGIGEICGLGARGARQGMIWVGTTTLSMSSSTDGDIGGRISGASRALRSAPGTARRPCAGGSRAACVAC